MALLTEDTAFRAANRVRVRRGSITASQILTEERATMSASFDIFLSHNIRNADLVVGVVEILRENGKTVYVDWLEDPQMDRSRVTPRTADMLRTRMKQSQALFYLHSRESNDSKWMPWELGFFDGLKGNVAILPVVNATHSYSGQEYLGLYPFVDLTSLSYASATGIRINQNQYTHQQFDAWKQSSNKLRPAS